MIDKESVKFKGPFKEQSYIVRGTPPKLIVAVNAKRTQDHGSICRQILDYIRLRLVARKHRRWPREPSCLMFENFGKKKRRAEGMVLLRCGGEESYS